MLLLDPARTESSVAVCCLLPSSRRYYILVSMVFHFAKPAEPPRVVIPHHISSVKSHSLYLTFCRTVGEQNISILFCFKLLNDSLLISMKDGFTTPYFILAFQVQVVSLHSFTRVIHKGKWCWFFYLYSPRNRQKKYSLYLQSANWADW